MSDLTPEAEKSVTTKIALRNQLITMRRQLPPSGRRTAATKLQDQILDLVRREAPSTVAAYVPIGAEPGGADLPAALARHARVLLPVLLPDNDLDWASYDGAVRPGPRGLALVEPTGPRLGPAAILTADLILVPALAVDRYGRRMGRGGGSYDRALARLGPPAGGPPRTGPLVVALLHDWELIDEVPAEPHDRSVHGVITPTHGFALSRPAEWTK
jgi:5-formyltetrahydrofolate cyclo-ligase